MGKSVIPISSPFGISMGRSTIAAIGTILTISTVNHLLFRVVTKNTIQLLEASFNSIHSGKGNTGSTGSLVLHR